MHAYPHYTLINIDYLYPCSTTASDLTISHDNYRFVHGDIKDTDLLQQIFEEVAIDTVVHFAAQSHVDTSFTNPLLYTQDNVQGTHSLLEACRKHGHVKRFIHISTDEVYGENAADDHTAKTATSRHGSVTTTASHGVPRCVCFKPAATWDIPVQSNFPMADWSRYSTRIALVCMMATTWVLSAGKHLKSRMEPIAEVEKPIPEVSYGVRLRRL